MEKLKSLVELQIGLELANGNIDIILEILKKRHVNSNSKNQEILDKVVYAKDKKAAKLEQAKDEGFEIYRNEDYKEA